MANSPSTLLELRAAVLKDASGEMIRLQAVKADKTPSRRRPVRLTLLAADRELAIELSRREAIELAEWLDDAVTRGS